MLIGVFAIGRLADRVGRRLMPLAAVGIDACFGAASAFAPDFSWLLALRLLTGIGVSGLAWIGDQGNAPANCMLTRLRLCSMPTLFA